MQILNAALPLGPYDWDPARDPQRLYEERLEKFREIMLTHYAGVIVLHGSTFDYGALAYLTGFMPKLGPAFAFVPLEGGIRIVFTGGPGMRSSAQRLTWVEDVKSYKTVGEAFALWCKERSLPVRSSVGIGNVAGFSLGEWNDLARYVGAENMLDLSAPIDALRRRKRAVERARIARASILVEQVANVFASASFEGRGIRTAALEAERAGYGFGAQNVRIMASLKSGGLPVAFDNNDDPVVKNPHYYVAACLDGYWSDGHFARMRKLGLPDNARQAILSAFDETTRSGISHSEMQTALDRVIPHILPVGWRLAEFTGNGIGLSLEEAPCFEPGKDALLQGDVVSLTITLADPDGRRLSISSMLSVESASAQRLIRPKVALSAPVRQ